MPHLRTLLVLGPLAVPLFTGCASEPSRAESLRAQYRETSAAQARRRSDPLYRSPEGFQEARWGMSQAEVRALYPAAQVVDGTLQVDGLLAEQPARLRFGFVEDRLAGVRCTLKQPQGQFDVLRALLVRKYGQPAQVSPDPQSSDAEAAGMVASVLVGILSPPSTAFVIGQNRETQAQLARQQAQLDAQTNPRGAIWLRPETRIAIASQPQGTEALVVDYLWRAYGGEALEATTRASRASEQRALDSL